ncbi:ribose-5-phosphate isomerase RpiA [Bacillus sp. 1P06AnD]|uniref:ribose-5-phosphate isomerase RpiA n=1 Tax=Bacillus sp. 1P06AnD TaxID=3132208 RepID=UPI0039A05ABA
MNEKQLVGEKATEFIKDGMVLGLGTGSTVFYTIAKLGEMVKEGLSVQGVPTSKATEALAKRVGIPLLEMEDLEKIDLAIDGADEVDTDLQLIKGGGGALLREKIIAHHADVFLVVADSSKYVTSLGRFPLPVEVVPFGWKQTIAGIREIGGRCTLRLLDGKPFITDNGNYIVDCHFGEIQPARLAGRLNALPGVVENGLFIDMADYVITQQNGIPVILEKSKQSIDTE